MSTFMRHPLGRRPLGIWIALACMAFCIIAGGGGQAISMINWQWAVGLGLQENDIQHPDKVERVLANMEWGVSAADTLFVLPLFVMGFIGVIRRRLWGVMGAFMAVACWSYMFCTYSLQRLSLAVRTDLIQWQDYSGIIVIFGLGVLLPGVLTVWGLWANIDRYVILRPHNHGLRRKFDGLAPSLLEDFVICTGQVLRTIPQVWIRKNLTWNTTPEEVGTRLAGDRWVSEGVAVNRAIAIDQPLHMVWPWIARFGRGAAFYSWDFLDNRGHRHPDYLVEAPPPTVGDWCKALGKIKVVTANDELVWYDEAPFFGFKMPLAINFHLTPTTDNGTRVHFRMTMAIPDTLKGRIALRVGLLMDQVMSTEMLRRLKLLIETYEQRLETGEINRPMAPHQREAWRPAAGESTI